MSEKASINSSFTVGLHWFRRDLRLQDNPCLQRINQCVDLLILVYVFDFDEQNSTSFNTKRIGHSRYRFIHQCLQELDESLQQCDQKTQALAGNPIDLIEEIVTRNNVSVISVEPHPGVYERRQVAALKAALPRCTFIEENASLLYSEADFPFSLENMPDTFSPFRRKVEKFCCPRSTSVIDLSSLSPPPDNLRLPSLHVLTTIENSSAPHDYPKLHGGHLSGMSQLEYYAGPSKLLGRYKETRNGLDGWDFSSKLSAYLAHGCISPAQILEAIKAYEIQHEANESTYWLFFELLWREFFHWQLYKQQERMFRFSGIQGHRPTSGFNAARFEAWCNGDTGYAIVDACMNQLNYTGYMSNRGRQLVASCFVHELDLDWRYGAAYFEQQLIDYDPASNWGNWQYLAGVGSDPRGHRQFNLAKQTQTYDPEGEFIQKWLPNPQ